MRNIRNRIEPEQNVVKRNFSHFIKYQKKYIILVMVLLFTIQMLSNLIADKPSIVGSESYYHLSLSKQGLHYNPLVNLISVVPENSIFLIPLLLGIFSVLLLFNLSKNLLDKETTFFFILFLVLTPGFIFSIVTLSSYALFMLLILTGFYLLSKQNQKLRYLSLLPFIPATMFDLFSTLLLLILQLIYFSKNKGKSDKLSFHVTIITAILLILNQLVFRIPVILTFHRQELFPDLLSDLGGLSGLGLFVLILSFIGFAEVIRKKKFQFLYLLPFLITAYFFSTNVIFFLSVVVSLLASFGFLRLFEKNWNLLSLKKFTVIILILGISFSTLAYMDRLPDSPPLKEDKEALSWVKENTPANSVVLSAPENTYYIKHFAERSPVYVFDKGSNTQRKELSEDIFTSLYIQDLFPLLEENNVDFVYINRDIKKELPADQGFLFLLKNERFKLIHSSGDSEVWVFEDEEE